MALTMILWSNSWSLINNVDNGINYLRHVETHFNINPISAIIDVDLYSDSHDVHVTLLLQINCYFRATKYNE